MIELQEIDCNCDDCIFMVRDIDKYKSFDSIYTNSIGQITRPSHRINYGRCDKFKKDVSFIPNTCQIETQECFFHRRKSTKIDPIN
jgi:hypothetical protein